MYTDPKFTGYLRSFKIDGVPKYPDYRVGLSELSLGSDFYSNEITVELGFLSIWMIFNAFVKKKIVQEFRF